MTHQTVLTNTGEVNSPLHHDHNMWSGRGGGRHYILWRTLLGMADGDGRIKASRREIHLASNITSHAGLQRSLDHLVAEGMIEVIDSGSADAHSHIEDRKRGTSAEYRIRQRGSSDPSVLMVPDGSLVSLLSYAKHEEDDGRSPLPNATDIDLRLDIWGDEPHLLRLVDIMIALGASGFQASPVALSRALGIRPSSAHEMIGRLRDRSMVRDGWIDLEDVLYFGRGWERSISLGQRMKREMAVRSEALAGRWVPRRMRIAQRFITKALGRFSTIDWDAAARVAELQSAKARRGEVPWLDRWELADVKGTPA